MMSAVSYQESHEVSRFITRQHAKSFYFASHVLPPKKREAAYAIYAFCRLADDGIDLATAPGEMQAHLKRCRDLLDRIYAHDRAKFSHPIEPAFEQAVARYEIPKSLFLDLITGLILDSHFKQPRDQEELLNYCYHVAGCVGLIMTHVFGASQEAHAHAVSLGNAMQITNIARDIKEDAARGRVYLPLTWLDDAGLTPDDFFALARETKPSPEMLGRIWSLEKRLVALGDGLYTDAWKGVPALTADGSRFCVSLMALTYGGILKKIKRKGTPALLHRQSLSLFEKLLLVPRAYGAHG